MKRSEMVDILYQAILDNVYVTDAIDEAEVDKVLFELEKVGMKPPGMESKTSGNVLFIWEDEDEAY